MSKGRRYKENRKRSPKRSPWTEENTTYVSPKRHGSYDYTRPEVYHQKDERPGTTGLYKPDNTPNRGLAAFIQRRMTRG